MMLLSLPTDEAHLWYLSSHEISPAIGSNCLELLTPIEQERSRYFSAPGPALEFVLGRSLLRSILGGYLGIAPRDVQIRVGPHGKPELEDPSSAIKFSLAHSHGLISCVAARDCDLGLDVEDAHRRVDPVALAARFFDANELTELLSHSPAARPFRFYQYWTLKEACLKAIGAGLTEPLDRFCFRFDAGDEPCIWRGAGQDHWQVVQLRIAERYLVAVAIKHLAQSVERRLRVRCYPLHAV